MIRLVVRVTAVRFVLTPGLRSQIVALGMNRDRDKNDGVKLTILIPRSRESHQVANYTLELRDRDVYMSLPKIGWLDS